MDSKILIAIILSLAAVVAYQELVLKRLYPPPNENAGLARVSTPGAYPSPAAGLPTAIGGVSSAESGRTQIARPEGTAAGVAVAEGRNIKVETDLYTATFTTLGGRLKSLMLKKFKSSSGEGAPPLEMVVPGERGELPLGVVWKRGDTTADDSAILYQPSTESTIEVGAGENSRLTFRGKSADGLAIEKTFSFNDSSYVLGIKSELSGETRGLQTAGFEMSRSLSPGAGYYDVPEVQADIDQKAFVDAEKALRKGVAPVSGKITYAGFGDRYFLSVFLPENPFEGTLVADYDGSSANTQLLFPVPAAADSISLKSGLYYGPKQLEVLEAVNPDLRRAIDFGWTGLLALALLRALKLFHFISGNWGVAIILLTVAIRVLFLPMSIKSQRSMMRLQRLQPQVERLKEKFSGDKERLNREMVDLYKRNHVNPMGGCAPMLLQLPIFIGLYSALLNSIELRHAPFFGWITDLSRPDCLHIPGMPVLPYIDCAGIPVLVLLMGLSTFLQQKMMPQAADPNQQKMMMFTPIIFTIMLVKFPAGLSLYYFSSNVLGIIQQYFLNREFKQTTTAVAATA
ncbi:MAG TPA: membrane protein insertase YidC [Candidatus Binataceae bacterium]|jgi:YidC/Oxa1 family membrane protein insertase